MRYAVIGTLLFLWACKPKPAEPPPPTQVPLTVQIRYEVDGQPLQPDTLLYTNDAENRYSITKLRYYLSRFTLTRNDGFQWRNDTVIYMDALQNPNPTLSLGEIPSGTYVKLEFYIGVYPERNKTGALPNTVENMNMQWPDAMGGGYHHLKLEGRYLVKPDSTAGYAMHLGTNAALPQALIRTSLNIQGDAFTIPLTMNINEWFRNPYVYDFNTKSYIMGDTLHMQQIAENGADVFQIKP